MAGVEQHGSGWSYRISYRVGKTRKWKRVTGFPTEAAAEAARNAEMQRRKRGPANIGNMTVEAWLEFWIENHASLKVAQTTLQKYELGAAMIIESIGNLPLASLRPADIQPMIAAWAQEYMPSTVHMYYEPLRIALNQAVKLSYISYNPCNAVTLPKIKKSPRKTLTHGQVGQLLDAIKGKPLYIPVLLASTAGMRRGEIAGLRWEYVNFDSNTISIAEARVRSLKDGAVISKDTKTDESMRSVDVDPGVMAELKAHRESLPDKAGYVCLVRGEPIKPDYITQALSRTLARLNLPHVSVHGLRHTHASIMLLLGVHPKVVQERLGHKKISTTLDIYSHVLPSLQRESAKMLADKIFGRVGEVPNFVPKKDDDGNVQDDTPTNSGNDAPES